MGVASTSSRASPGFSAASGSSTTSTTSNGCPKAENRTAFMRHSKSSEEIEAAP
ncbi:hypothetical protein GCM10012319_64270 [Comamonas sp. KCTC 72670]|nr:hypothetical protein GCM10012319_64270 [Comamonas sp. KCTC 72670]